jgi:hypothetical protein
VEFGKSFQLEAKQHGKSTTIRGNASSAGRFFVGLRQTVWTLLQPQGCRRAQLMIFNFFRPGL